VTNYDALVLQNLSDALPTINAADAAWRRRRQESLGIEEENRRHWAIQRDPVEADIRLWRERNVEIFDSNLDEFIKKLGRSLHEVHRVSGRI
jgi:hypothetical protein